MADISSFSPLWGEWYIKELLGKGTFGAVYRAEKTEYGNTYVSAVKHITIPCQGMEPDELINEGAVTDMNSVKGYYDDLRDQFIKEINVCYALRGNTNIVAYEDHCIIPKKDGLGYDIFIRMEYLTALTAYMRTKQMTEKDIIRLGIDICTGLEVLDENHLLHRDIKPANIFVSSKGIYKLGDFGEAKVLSGASVGMSIRGTYAYMSPEISRGDKANISADIYSLGLVMYRLLNGNRPPFVPLDTPKISAQMQETANTRRFRGEMLPVPAYAKSPELCRIIMKACEYKPQDRWQNPEDMKEALTALKKAMKAQTQKPVVSASKPVAPAPKPVPQAKQTAVNNQETVPVSSVKSAVPIPPPAKTAPVSDQVTIPVSAVKPVQQPAGVSSQPMSVVSVEDTQVKKKSKKPIIIALIVAAAFTIGVPAIAGISSCGGNSSKETSFVSNTETSKEEYKDPEYTLGTIIDSGNCGKDGDNVTYQLDDKGLLVISGSGEMKDYIIGTALWRYKEESIKTVILKEGITSIGDWAFHDCTSLESMTIPKSVTSIGDYAFYGCTSLTSINIPDSVTSIGDYAFDSCTSLTSITIPESVTSIGDHAFFYCTSLESITIPESVTTIGGGAFSWCWSLTSINIPDSVTSIGRTAFEKCYGLTSITIPAGVTDMGMRAFEDWKSFQTIYIEGKGSAPGGWDENWNEYCGAKIVWDTETDETSKPETSQPETSKPEESSKKEYKDPEYTLGTIAASGNCGKDGGNVTYQLDDKGLLVISGSGEMKNYTYDYSARSSDAPWDHKKESIKTVILKEGITSIGDYAFSSCKSLTSITIPDSVTSIGYWAFTDCKSLESITIPDSVTSIGHDAFKGCESLESITIPKSVTSIGDDAFSYCKSLTSITIPDSVTSIGGYAFNRCESLTSITIPDSVTSIGIWAFSFCDSLESITIPDSVTSIGDYAFNDCKSLESITIPKSVTSIGYNAFDDWTSSQTIYIRGRSSAPIEWDKNWNKDCGAKIVWNA